MHGDWFTSPGTGIRTIEIGIFHPTSKDHMVRRIITRDLIAKSNMASQKEADEADEAKSLEPPRDAPFSQFTVNTKRYVVAMGSLASFFSPLSSSIYLPALTTIASELHVSTSQVNLTVTTYLVCTPPSSQTRSND